jgi:UPF0755 protein
MNKAFFSWFVYVLTAIILLVVVIGLAYSFERKATIPRTITVTIIPGSTINTIAKQLSRAGLPSQTFLKLALPTFSASTTPLNPVATSSGVTSSDLANAGLGLEGYLYPDTYNFSSNQSAERIIKTLTDNFDKHFPQELFDRQKDANQKGIVRSKRDIVIMASILEKEVATDEDRKIVAGILWKRLGENLPLQVDSTSHYFLGAPNGVLYNTYKNTGLPFGPICNPSLSSLKAALLPTASDYWYFLSTKEGRIVYSKTLGEHLINKAKYIE